MNKQIFILKIKRWTCGWSCSPINDMRSNDQPTSEGHLALRKMIVN